MHPTSNYASGASMIKHLYDAVRNSQYWDNTYVASLPTLGVWMNYPSLIKSHAVLSSILNFDEHGGFADHVAPPMNIPAPEDGIIFNGSSEGFNLTYDFTRLGIRYVAHSLPFRRICGNEYEMEQD